MTLRLASRGDLLAEYPKDAEFVSQQRRPDGRVGASVRFDPVRGYLLAADGFGCFLVAPDGGAVSCAPVRAATWRWQRYLVGQVLPFAAVLRGLEVFHASVVALAGGAVVFLGWSGAGKSSIAAALMLDGQRLVADDVMAVDASGSAEGAVAAHPGWGLMSIRHDAATRLGSDAVRSLGRPVGVDDEAARLQVDLVDEPRTIAALYVVERSRSVGPATIEPIVPADPRLLLASTYNFLIRTPERLIRQLDVCARLSRTATLARLTISPGAGPSDAAAAVRAHASSLVSAG